MSTETAPQTAPEVNNDANITLGDFVLIQNIIATASRRGAFESKEFTVIGQLVDRIESFVKANSPPPEEAPAAEEAQGELELTLDSEG